jgi:hypothetical protein
MAMVFGLPYAPSQAPFVIERMHRLQPPKETKKSFSYQDNARFAV